MATLVKFHLNFTNKKGTQSTVNSVAIDEAQITQTSLSNQAASTLQIYHFSSAPKDEYISVLKLVL